MFVFEFRNLNGNIFWILNLFSILFSIRMRVFLRALAVFVSRLFYFFRCKAIFCDPPTASPPTPLGVSP